MCCKPLHDATGQRWGVVCCCAVSGSGTYRVLLLLCTHTGMGTAVIICEMVLTCYSQQRLGNKCPTRPQYVLLKVQALTSTLAAMHDDDPAPPRLGFSRIGSGAPRIHFVYSRGPSHSIMIHDAVLGNSLTESHCCSWCCAVPTPTPQRQHSVDQNHRC